MIKIANPVQALVLDLTVMSQALITKAVQVQVRVLVLVLIAAPVLGAILAPNLVVGATQIVTVIVERKRRTRTKKAR